jgi:hypothetical protein
MQFRKLVTSFDSLIGHSIPDGQTLLVRRNDLQMLIKKVSKSSEKRSDEGFITSNGDLSVIFPLSQVSYPSAS